MLNRLTGVAALLAALLAQCLCTARAELSDVQQLADRVSAPSATTIYLNGTEVVGTNSIPAGAEYDNLVFVFDNPAASNTLTLDPSVRANARILLIGGGGAGGSGGGTGLNHGGGGGGGAGGYVEAPSVALVGGDYSIMVGAGGVAGADASTTKGGNGGSSLISFGGSTLVAGSTTLEAFGGGGGGAESDGEGYDAVGGINLASGGGGSREYSGGNINHVGGAGMLGQGNKGGDSKLWRAGGGGGGAGTEGATSANANYGGNGGDGLTSDITGEVLYYAGGGGGGTGNQSNETRLGQPGKGGGGRGAGNADYAPLPGNDGFGGGGGGGSLTVAGANGGCGTVIVRITQIVETKVAVPTIADKTYNKENQVALELGIKYTFVDGTLNATNVDTYAFRVTPGPELEWIDGGTEPREVSWKIIAREIAKPEVVGDLVFQAGVNQIGVTVDDDSAKYCTFSAASVTNAVNADVYTYAVSLDDKVNTIWKGGGTDDISGTWTISSAKVTRPAPSALEFTYDNTEKSVFAASSLPELDTRYRLDSGDIKATEGGSYSFKFTLIGNDEATNYVWADSETDEPYEATWTIKPAANAIRSLSLTGWRIGSPEPNKPTCIATWGEPKYVYGFGKTADDVTEWISDPTAIDREGTWVVKATIAADASWEAAEATKTFEMWNDPGTLYAYSVDIAIKGAAAEVTDFPVFVKISESLLGGFEYAKESVAKDGKSLFFIDKDDNPLAYDIDTWNTSGESGVWIKLPKLPVDGTTVTMYWGLKDGSTAPRGYTPAEVWTDYVGVWHLSETAAGAAVVKDASGHKDGTGHASSLVSAGLFGAARGRNVTGVNGPAASVPVYDELNGLTAGSFTVSGWAKPSVAATAWAYLFARKNQDSYQGWGAQFRGSGGASETVGVYYSNNNVTFNTTGKFAAGTWTKYDVVYEPARVTLYINGAAISTKSFTGSAVGGTEPFTIGGMNRLSGSGNGLSSTFNGYSDEVRIRPSAASAELIAAEYAAATTADFIVPGEVKKDGVALNYWIDRPTLDKLLWDVTESPAAIANAGSVAHGVVTNVIYSVYDKTQTFTDLSQLTASGFYRIEFFADGAEGYAEVEKVIYDLQVTMSQPYGDIGGVGGDSGRVLLMNNHIGEDGHPDIDYQGWYDADNAGAKKSNTPTYWHHVNLTAPGTTSYNLKDGTESTLYALDGRRLWHIVNCRHGNTFPTKTADALIVYQNYLPYTPTYSKTITGHRANQAATTRSTVGQLVMQNTEDAVVYSSCFTNGIGTIYFDAVNGWCRKNPQTGESIEDYENYKIVVEYATNTVYGTVPTDVNSMTVVNDYDEEENLVVTTNLYGNITADQWHRAEMIPFIRDNTAEFERQDATNELALAVKTGGTMNNFYRIVVPLDIAGPVRFRIRRVSHDAGYPADNSSFILLDNIIASVPADRADLVSAGHFDAEKTGRQILGWELSTSVPYPSKDDTGVMGAAVPVFQVHSGDPETVDTSKFVASATMHYRWRYLNQDAGEWKSVDLNPSDGFRALSAFEFPGRACDIEYWFDYRLQAPFYSYVDYSGSGKAIDYTEERGTLTNRLDSAETLASGGRDWFFRLRDGRSKYAALDIVYKRAGSSVVEREHMALDGDGLWRGFVQTRENQTGPLTYRIEALDYQDAPFAEYAATTNYWHCKLDNPEFPVSDSLEEGTAESWSKITLDAVTGHVMFQIDDRTNPKSITIVHADYQNFNGWSDARDRKGSDGNGPIFVGTSTTNEYKVGVSPSKQTFREAFSDWQTMPATNEYWMVPRFNNGYDDINHLYGTASAYETFTSVTNGLWAIGQGMWVSRLYKHDTDNSGVAIQMEGNGKGYLQFTDEAAAPRGLESVSFNARLGQFIRFDDFAYYYGDVISKMQNYTFVTRAAFDLNKNGGFAGNGSLSLVANYLPSKGCYEARLEWIGTKLRAANGSKGQRLCLYKWTVNGDGTKTERLLTAWTNNVYAPVGVSALNTSGYFTPYFISVSNDTANACTWVMTGIRVQNNNTHAGGVHLNDAWNSGNSGDWQIIRYRDSGNKTRLTKGTYGVLTANCPGILARPQISYMTPANIVNLGLGNGANEKKKETVNLSLLTDIAECVNDFRPRDDETEEIDWNIIPGRMATTNSTSTTDNTRYNNGIMSAPAAQKLKIFLGTPGRSDWGEAVTNIALTSFGSPTKPFVLPLYTTKDCSVRFEVDGTIEDVRTDIVIDSVVLKQWRGGNWNTDGEINGVSKYLPAWASPSERSKVDAHTNFVFTSAWVTNNTVLLSAKRTRIDEPCSIRSPLLDGGGINRGFGLGMISIEYANADENTELQLYIATNNVGYATVDSYDRRMDESIWGKPITNYTFRSMSAADRRKGTLNTYIGLHAVEGVIRVMVSTNSIAKVANVTDTTKFGEITITKIACSDEPPVDIHSWWGWNMRTEGDDTDSEKRMYLADFPGSTGDTGLSLALNESVSATYNKSEIDVSDRESYLPHNPFVQTPTFTSNVVGEVVFKARKFSSHDEPAAVVLLGSMDASDKDEGTWSRLDGGVFYVTNTYYETYSYKTDPGRNYTAFRLAVMGVEDVREKESGGGSGLPPGVDEPHRVLIDEMYVSEAVRTRMGFRHVGCFRGDPSLGTSLSSTTEVPGVPSRKMQPLCGESWGVQCEVYGAQLAGDIDFAGHQPRVKLHWYAGDTPWGYEKWKDDPSAGSAWLSRATGTDEDRYVYRSSMKDSPEAVMSMSTMAPTYVQYMLEVEYYTVGSTKPVTNWMSAADWVVPEWYRPLDLNAEYGGGKNFAAYNILDNVAPDWAWINEVNVFGEFPRYRNTDADCQYIEIAHPPEADISGWTVRLLEPRPGDNMVVTNVLVRFGDPGLPGTKQIASEDAAANMVFRVIANKATRQSGKVEARGGKVEAVWKVDNPTLVFTEDGEISAYDPVAIQLVRSSRIVEHEIMIEGTNFLESLDIEAPDYLYQMRDWTTNRMVKSSMILPGYDMGGVDNSLSVTQNFGRCGMEQPTNDWTNGAVMTPGHVNDGQFIDPNHPMPAGEELLVYFTVSGDHIEQSFDGVNFTNGMFSVVVGKNSTTGTNVIYRTDPWYVLASATTNAGSRRVSIMDLVSGRSAKQPYVYTLSGVAKGIANNVTVMASAELDPRIAGDWGVPEDDPYHDAIVDWLRGGVDLYGNPFKDVESGEVRLAKFRSMNGTVVTNLTLREMYWLDMDPTAGQLSLTGGMKMKDGDPTHEMVWQFDDGTSLTLTNTLVDAYLMISNEDATATQPDGWVQRGPNDRYTHWTPYVLRGLVPGENSQGYTSARDAWGSVSFKVTGTILNGYTSPTVEDNRVPLRQFVFDEDSFGADGWSHVEVRDPHSPLSYGYNSGWKRVWEKDAAEGRNPSEVFYFWSIDTRLPQMGTEMLNRENYYGE